MKKVLVIYFTQTGQLERALKATLAPLENDPSVEIHYERLQPVVPYPFPWPYTRFFDAFPECVHGVPTSLQPFTFNPEENYDLVIIGYQPWFLSVCIPVNSFLQADAAKALANKPVITVLACRNMWLNAQEKMKTQLQTLGANLVGNITYVDKASNLVSLVTVLAFALGGVKEKFLGFFPKYGVSDKDLLNDAPTFGATILQHLKQGSYEGLQTELNKHGAVQIKRNLMLLEGRGKVLFPLYANYISKKGTAGSAERKTRVKIFGIVLPTAILILSPLITIVSRLTPVFFPGRIKKEVAYYSQNALRQGRYNQKR